MSEQKKLTGKNKKIVNAESFVLVPRMNNHDGPYLDISARMVQDDYKITKIPYLEKDLLRICLGKNWDLSKKQESSTQENFDKDWTPLSVFYDYPLEIDHCHEAEELSGTSTYGQLGLSTQEKIIISTTLDNSSPGMTEDEMSLSIGKDTKAGAGYDGWTYLIKTGLIDRSDANMVYEPIINATASFYDHYHKASTPFSIKELENKQPISKTCYARYNSYYNEMVDARAYRKTIASDYLNPRVRNMLPTIYGFLRFLMNKEVVESDLAAWREIVTHIYNVGKKSGKNIEFWSTVLQPNAITVAKADGTNLLIPNLFNSYPLETLVTLFGYLGTVNSTSWPINSDLKESLDRDIVEKVILSNKNSRLGAFREYFRNWTALMNPQSHFSGHVEGAPSTHWHQGFWRSEVYDIDTVTSNTALITLEKAFFNMIFEPGSTDIFKSVDEYKNYFPFYNEIEFSTELESPTADLMNLTHMNSILAVHFAAEFSKDRYLLRDQEGFRLYRKQSMDVMMDTGPTGPVPLPLMTGSPEQLARHTYETDEALSFYDLNEETVYESLEKINDAEALYEEQQPIENTKVVFDIMRILNNYIGEENYFELNLSDSSDIQNYIVNVRNDFEGTYNLTSGNLDDTFLKNLFGPAFKASLAQKYKENRRTYRDILDGKPAYSEDMFYMVQKVFVGANNPARIHEPIPGEVLQNIFFPNSSNLDVIKYVDTQVKYLRSGDGAGVAREKYRYDIYALRLVYGAKYSYRWYPFSVLGQESALTSFHTSDTINLGMQENYDLGNAIEDQFMAMQSYNKAEIPSSSNWSPEDVSGKLMNNLGGGMGFESQAYELLYNGIAWEHWNQDKEHYQQFKAMLKVIVEPDIKIISDKLFSTKTMSILEKPPVPPFVDILPYRAVNNRIKIILNGATDRFRARPVHILESDASVFEEVLESQLSADGKVEFANDSPTTNFQIFRTTVRPTSYSDFSAHPDLPQGTLNGNIYEEIILPNTKYYYTFRSVDHDGLLISNPGEVYEVELIDEKGAVRPVIKTISFDEESSADDVKEMQKYIYIAPSTHQLFFSEHDSVDSIFSSGDESKKRKKFKIRLISKSSGKRIDINILFKKTQNTLLGTAGTGPLLP